MSLPGAMYWLLWQSIKRANEEENKRLQAGQKAARNKLKRDNPLENFLDDIHGGGLRDVRNNHDPLFK